jgi:RND family efflux transporter MFP subunit
MKTTTVFILMAVLAVAGCNGHTHEHQESTAGSAHEDLTAERPVRSITHFTEATELFVEFPALVVGAPSPFAAHVTMLGEFKPLSSGRLEVVLSGGGAPEERFAAAEPQVPGIFRPEAEPLHAGERDLAVIVTSSDGGEDRHVLGRVAVYSSVADAAAAARGDAVAQSSTIPFVKEQQWQTEFQTESARTHSLRPSVLVHGSVRARAAGEALITSPLAGRLLSVGAEFPHLGSEVRRDQVLAVIAPSLSIDADHASLELGVRQGEIRRDHARSERERLEALYQQQAVPERRVIEARHEAAEAEAAMVAARKRLEQFAGTQRTDAGGAGARVDVRAPIDGVVAEVLATPGAFVETGSDLFHVVDPRVLWLEVRVPEAEIGAVQRPTGAWFEVDGFEQPFEVTEASGARLVAFGGVLDPETRTAPLIFEFPNRDGRLRIGMFARVRVLTGGVRTALAVPRSAIVDDRGRDTLFVQAGGESFERRTVTLGARDGELVEVISGLQPGERIVTRGAYSVLLAGSSGAAPAHGHAH